MSMSILHWLNPVDGTWNTSSDWTSGIVPGGADDALIDASGTSYVVTTTQDTAAGSVTLGASATLAIGGGTTFSINNGLSNAGALDVTDNAELDLQGATANSGTIALQSSLNGTLLLITSAGATLTGGGSLLLSDDAGNFIEGDGTLVNVDNTISGSGRIGAHTAFALVNHGIIDATGTNSTLVISSTIAVVNTGTLEASGPEALLIKQVTIDNAGGIILAQDGAHVALENATIAGGSLESVGTGFIQTFQPFGIGPSTLDGTTSSVAVTGDLQVMDNTTLRIQGEIDNSGTIELVSNGSSTVLQVTGGGATLEGGGSLTLSPNTNNVIQGSGTLTNVDNRISGAGSFVASGGTLTLLNQAGGIIVADGALNTLLLASGVAVTNDGVLGESGSHLEIFSSVNGSGHLQLSGSGGVLELHADTTEGVQFAAGTSGELQLDYQAGAIAPPATGVISGFGSTDSIQFNGYASTSNAFITFGGYNATDNTTTLFVSNGSVIGGQVTGSTLVFSGQYSVDHFELTGIPGQSSLGLTAKFNALPDVDFSNPLPGQVTVLNGKPGDFAGYSVSSAGDVNGDGISDLLVDAIDGWKGTGQGGAALGVAYVVYGKSGGLGSSIDLGSLTPTEGFAIRSAGAGDFFGRTDSGVHSAGDINGDGFADMTIGAPYSAGTAGTAYVIFGGSNASNVDLASLTDQQGFAIHGAHVRDYAGFSVSSVGDVNHDGIADLALSAPGAAGQAGVTYVIWGNNTAHAFDGGIDLGNLGARGFAITGGNANDLTGWSVSGGGDVNGDGFSDLIIGAPYAGGDGKTGATYVVFGGPKINFTSGVSLGDLKSNQGFAVVNGPVAGYDGFSVSGAGDVNGDGFGDIIIGDPGAVGSDGKVDGAVYVVFGHSGTFGTLDSNGHATVNLDTLASSGQGFEIVGAPAVAGAKGALVGWSVSAAGDVNGDGFQDLIISTPYGGPTASEGKAYVIYGHPDNFGSSGIIDLAHLQPTEGFQIQGQAGDNVGSSVAAAGDVNHDGYADLLVGAPFANLGSTNSGKAYIVYGGPGTSAPAGVAGTPINLALFNPINHTGPLAVTITGVPAGWSLNEGGTNEGGIWTVSTNDIDSLSITSPDGFTGAILLHATESWTSADGTTQTATIADNVEAYAPASPIYAWSGDDTLTGSTQADLFVFANPIGHDAIHGFDASADRIDLTGFAGMAAFADVQGNLGDDASGSAVLSLGHGQTITLQGVHAAALSADNFEFDQTPALTNAGTMTIGDGAMLPLSGNITNSGTIALNSVGDETDLQIVQHGITLDGHGQVILSDNAGNSISGTGPDVTLLNGDNTISGAGRIGEGHLTLVNDGSIVADGVNRLEIDTGSNPVTNAGTLEATGAGGLVVQSAVDNSGLLWANLGNVTLNGTVSGSGSALVSGAATLEFGAASSANVTFDVGATGTLRIEDSFHFTGTVSGMTDATHIDLAGIAFGADTSVSYQANAIGSGGTLTVSDGSHSANIGILGQYASDDFRASADDFGGTLIMRHENHIA
jgi:hypothetical protein